EYYCWLYYSDAQLWVF
nr:immunoglobulin light chain junction region [Macaca mulatta]MOW01494.1 immunoglobulin light chain junction region [Macaca mulatta]